MSSVACPPRRSPLSGPRKGDVAMQPFGGDLMSFGGRFMSSGGRSGLSSATTLAATSALISPYTTSTPSTPPQTLSPRRRRTNPIEPTLLAPPWRSWRLGGHPPAIPRQMSQMSRIVPFPAVHFLLFLPSAPRCLCVHSSPTPAQTITYAKSPSAPGAGKCMLQRSKAHGNGGSMTHLRCSRAALRGSPRFQQQSDYASLLRPLRLLQFRRLSAARALPHLPVPRRLPHLLGPLGLVLGRPPTFTFASLSL